MKFFLIGTGLIGGSISKDIRNLIDKVQIHGVDKNQINVQRAKDIGLIDSIDSLENLNIAFGLPFSIPPQDYIGH